MLKIHLLIKKRESEGLKNLSDPSALIKLLKK